MNFGSAECMIAVRAEGPTMTELALLPATLNDLHTADGKVELIGGRLVEFPMPGRRATICAEAIFRNLHDHVRRMRRGEAHADGADYTVPILSSGRESFRPDASFYAGPLPENDEDFFPGPPTFAVEVRSKEDYGPAEEGRLADKRADYFEAGTVVVWDVDPRARTIASYRRGEPNRPIVFRSGESAHAEPAVPGWKMTVDAVFE